MPDIVLRALQPDAANGAIRVVQETTAPLPGLHMFVGSTGGNPSGSDVVLRQQSWHPLPAVTPAGGGTTHEGAASITAAATVAASGAAIRGGAATITATAEVTADGRILRSSSGAGTYGRPRRRRHPTPAKTSQAHAALVLALLQEEYAL